MADRRRPWVRLGVALATVLVLAGCGDAAPTKAQFMSRTRGAIGDVKAAMVSKGIDPKVGDQMIDDLIACEYEAIKDDPELLQAAYEHAGKSDVVAKLDAKAGSCSQKFTTALTKAADAVTTTADAPGTGDEMTTIAPPTTEAATR